MSAVFSVIEDENGNVERIAFYNMCKDVKEAMAMLPPGTVISIMHPYVKVTPVIRNFVEISSDMCQMAADGGPLIRVDSSNSVIFHENREQICFNCTRTASAVGEKFKTCSLCKTARYCSVDCQRRDWNSYDHKVMCDAIKNKK